MHEIIFQGAAIRLDRYLRRIYPYLTQGIIEKSLRGKNIKVNDRKASSDLRLKHLDKITITRYLIRSDFTPEQPQATPNVIKLAEKILGEYLLYDHPQFIAINKPAHLAAQGGSKINISLDASLGYLNATKGCNLKLVHRIDKETSGLMLIAKNYDAATILTQSFKDRLIQKTYLAILVGVPESPQGRIANYLAKNTDSNSRLVEENNETGKLAITDYRVLKILANNYALVEFTPLTGRMDQIRVHAKKLGRPILGDSKYGNVQAEHMFLHAKKILLPESIFGKEISVEAPLPAYFAEI